MTAVTAGSAVAAPYAAPFTGPAVGTKDPQKVATEMAGLFYSMMFSEMEKSIPKNDYFGGKGEETFKSLWVNELGRQMAERPGDALSATILKSLEKSAANAAYKGGAR